MNRNSRSYRGRRRKKTPLENPVIRVLLAGTAVLLIVLLCIGATSLMPKLDPATLEPTSVPDQSGTPTPIPTPTPEPTITPTPAVFAPFGAQYGHGGENLIPETPTPEPTPAPTPTPIPAPTDAPTPTPVTYTTLRKGTKGPSVVKMQEALIALGYLDGSADGDFGSGTLNAVVQFQAVNGLSADGIAGSKTLTLLYSGDALDASQAPEMDYLILVNRDSKLDKNYAPTDLVEIADVIPESVLKVKYKGTRANRVATEALYRMLEDAIDEGVTNWQVSSAYRGYADQQALVDQSVAKYRKNNPDWSRERCLSATYQTVAPAGTSEHMTGLAFDITVPGVSFTGTKQQKWLHEHCYEYGFVVRFTEDKQDKTGFLAESWHFRYVGVQAAQVMVYNNWCLEEYVEKMQHP
ncbi:MAG: D-alanyl-D-alanine carboxypeptidase family protein [Clostridia bacterium]|nr:D-alanyl-D-alanine carboxypeptidase family protein [Clostridia bacterium]